MTPDPHDPEELLCRLLVLVSMLGVSLLLLAAGVIFVFL